MKFELTPDQEKKFKEWASSQPKESPRGAGDLGVWPYQFIFTRTNCGDCLTIKNTISGDEIDLTDYESF